MPKPETLNIHFRVVCVNPPQPAAFGLQDKDGRLVPGQAHEDGALVFEFELRAKPGANGTANFLGTYAHGTVDQRFVYLSLSDGSRGWVKRLKIPLSSIHWEQVEGAHANRRAFEATVDGTRAGTVPLIGGSWIVRSS